VPSSTSSFSPRKASARLGQPWLRIWGVALALTVLLLGSWEAGWRRYGFVPSVEDDWGIWASCRRRVESDADRVALVGASRIQLGVDPQRFRQASGHEAVMLAIDGSPPQPVLADLAADASFKGSVIVGYVPLLFAETTLDEQQAHKWLRKYRHQTESSRLETRLRVWTQEHLVFRYPGLAPARIWEHLMKATRPNLIYAPMRTDRYRAFDEKTIDITALREARARRELRRRQEARPLPPDAFAKRVKILSRLVRRIQAKGGRVAFVRMPSVGVVRRVEAAVWPRRNYWNRLANRISVPCIHFEDYPRLSAFDCPDGSHLAAADAQKFTAALVEILKNKGFFD
jgi:hypothetical protein